MVIADGVGSADLSSTGSALAVEAASRFLAGALCTREKELAEDPHRFAAVARAAVRETCWAIRDFAAYENLDPSRLSTTLGLAMVSGNSGVTAQVGDGLVVGNYDTGDTSDGRYAWIDPAPVYDIPTMTDALPGAGEAAIRVTVLEGLTEIFLSTDGLRGKLTHPSTGRVNIPLVTQLSRDCRARTSEDWLHKQLQQWADQLGDDTTLAMAVNPDPSGWTTGNRGDHRG